MPKMIGYLPKQHGLILLAEDTDGGSSVSFNIPKGFASIEWHFYRVHPASNQVDFTFQVNSMAADGTEDNGYNENMATTFYYNQHGEGAGGTSGPAYYTSRDQDGDDGAYQPLNYESGADADQGISGVLTLYDPDSHTFQKQFLSRTENSQGDDFSVDAFAAGYILTAANRIYQIDFKFTSGNIEYGKIRMYGVR